MARPLKNLSQIAVIGGGIAGLAAARQATRLGRLVTLFEPTGMYGGQVATVEQVDGLGTPGHFSGQDIAIGLLEAARKAGARIVEAPVLSVDLGTLSDGRLTLTDGEGGVHHPEAIVVASGASARKLGVANEDSFVGRGLSHCATCDGGFFRGADVAVIGGGDAAVTEAMVLARTSRTVFLVTHSPLKAKRECIERIDAKENVRFVWDSEVAAILGDGEVTGLTLRDVRSGATSALPCAGLFPYIGWEPVSGFLPAAMRDAAGYVRAGDDLATCDHRIFAAGAVRAGYGGNVAQAMAEGVGAAEAAHRMIAAGVLRPGPVTVAAAA